jgi:glucose/arabinose dehydrogenase/regulation of enolase protein 1 (concanavalin A-like superfamily)
VLGCLALAGAVFIATRHGPESRQPIGPYLDGAMPPKPPAPSGGGWEAVPAFPRLTFQNPVGLTFAPGTSRLYVWEREGRVWSFDNNPSASQKTLVLDLSKQCQGWDDSGLLGLAFHPDFQKNRYLYVWYTYVPPGTVQGDPNHRLPVLLPNRDRLSRFTLDEAGVAIAGSELVMLEQNAGSIWHNGGGMFFHPEDGFLYVTNGDDASTANSQVLTQNLFSCILRIDVDKRGGSISHPPRREPVNGRTRSLPGGPHYYIPNDNPFVGVPDALEEIWALGLRSPHRMTFDPVTRRIFVGDVGETAREEITVIEPTDPFGLNLQWPYREGFLEKGARPRPLVGTEKPPVLDYGHGGDGVAVIGGFVYRGAEHAGAWPQGLTGEYLFGDNGSGKIWRLNQSTHPASKEELCTLPNGAGPKSGNNYVGLSSFGLDEKGELYLCQLSSTGGQIYKLARTGAPTGPPLPKLLSGTGAFQAPVSAMIPSRGMVPYTVNSPLWSDGASKSRWIAVPNDGAPYGADEQVGFAPKGAWTFPSGTVLVKHFELAVDDAEPSVKRRLETRLLVRDPTPRTTSNSLYGVTYKWRADNSDAELLDGGLTEHLSIKTTAPVGAFQGVDIGGPAPAGSTLPVEEGYRITAGGRDIWAEADQFHFAHQPRTGDFDVIARVASLTSTDLYTKAGLMVREALDANSRHAFAMVFPTNAMRQRNTGAYEFQYRDRATGASTALYPEPSIPGDSSGTWVRLRRQGDRLTGYASSDGVSWTPFGTVTLPHLPATVFLGMAVTSHANGRPAIAEFRELANVRAQEWYYPSRSDCLFCHNATATFVLGVNTRQLNGAHTSGSAHTDNQLRAWNQLGLLGPGFHEADLVKYNRLAPVTDGSASLEHRARSYIDANCSHCHRPGGVHSAFFDGRYETPLELQGIVGGRVFHTLGIDGAKVVQPRDLERSVLFQRDSTRDPAIQMPPLATSVVDTQALEVMRGWIHSLHGPPVLAAPTISPGGGGPFNQSVEVTLRHDEPGAVLHYTLDGTAPTPSSIRYLAPFTLETHGTVTARAFKTGFGESVSASAAFTVTPLRPPENPAGLVKGLGYQAYEGHWQALPDFDALRPVKTDVTDTFDVGVRSRGDSFALRFTGYLEVPADGLYTFYTSSDDGSRLYIGGTLVVDNDGLHAPREQSGSIGLQAGKHAITVTMFDASFGEALTVSYSGPGLDKRPIPDTALFRQASVAAAVITPEGGNFAGAQTVSLRSATEGASIFYTTDGSVPTIRSTLYTAPLKLTSNALIRALAVSSGMRPSAVTSTTFTRTDAPPRLQAVLASGINTSITVVFDKPVDVTSASDKAHYALDGLTVSSATAAGDTVTLTTSAMAEDSRYTLRVNGVRDLAGGVIAPGSSMAFRYFPAGSISREYWTGMGGRAIPDLTSNPSYPNEPAGGDQPKLFEAPDTWADDYGTRMRGYFIPSRTARYTFALTSDDAGELWLSTDEKPANKARVAHVDGWTGKRKWTSSHGGMPPRYTTPAELIRGQRYYLEALQKEASGEDHLAVLAVPMGTEIPDGESPLGGSLLAPYIEPMRILAQPASQTVSAGQQVTFSLVAAGSAPRTYQWRKNGVSLPGATGPRLTLNNVTGEDAGHYSVVIGNPSNSVTSERATLTVTPRQKVSFSAASSTGSEQLGTARLEVSLSAIPSVTASVDYTVTGGEATPGGRDYQTLVSGTLYFTAGGPRTRELTLSLVPDLLDEPDETVRITLSNPVNAELGAHPSHLYTIQDDDDAPTVSFVQASSNSQENAALAAVQVELHAPSGRTVVVPFTVAGTTGRGTDHSLDSGKLTFRPGEKSKVIHIPLVDDVEPESAETIILVLGTPTDATLGAQGSHTLTILDNEPGWARSSD